MVRVGFFKFDERAVVPSKRDEDAAFDIYGVYDNDETVIKPGEVAKIDCMIGSVIPDTHAFVCKERSSVGSKGIAVRAGVIDSGYRGHWIICLNNTTNKTFIISKNPEETLSRLGDDKYNTVVYPASKAICQAMLIRIDQTEVAELSKEEFENEQSARGNGAFGSTGK